MVSSKCFSADAFPPATTRKTFRELSWGIGRQSYGESDRRQKKKALQGISPVDLIAFLREVWPDGNVESRGTLHRSMGTATSHNCSEIWRLRRNAREGLPKTANSIART